MTFRLRHLLAALTLHAMLATLLVAGVQCSPKVTRPPIIGAVLLDPSRQQTAQRRRDDERRKQEQARQERQRQEDLQKQKLAEQQRQQQAAARKAADQKKAAELAVKKKAADDAQKKKLAEQQARRAADEARRQQEQQDARDRQDAARRELQEKARMEDEMRRETAAIEAQREKDAQDARQRGEKQQEWGDLLSRQIAKNWNRPASAPDDLKCTVHVQLLPDGSVSSAKVASTCGSDLLNRSVEDAVYRASPLPKPADPSVFDRDLIVNFCPSCQ